ncbi:hypothetical protein CPB84DRAFT_1744813 [Gymnopilus junonius]|uniref:Uncharacterized protein n=1 Tax=Gymnopilus junonius TaxID=109634 RepID=A0A9P5NSF7_GYMJU|nr:hypothetical protein CPB84DRAFT_1744813 [Gymnopilus junonius]
MPYGIKFVPLSPGMYNSAPQSDFPDLDKLVPIEILMQARKDVDEYLASPQFENRAFEFPFQSDTSHEVSPASRPESSGYFLPDRREDVFDFLVQDDDSGSDTSASFDVDPGVVFNGTANEDISWDFSSDVFQENSDLPSDIASLIYSIDVEKMDPDTLDSFQKSLEELETMLKDTPMIESDI